MRKANKTSKRQVGNDSRAASVTYTKQYSAIFFSLCIGSAAAPSLGQSPKASPANLNFERGTAQTGLPVAWGGGGPGYEVSLGNANAHTGKASGQVRFIGNSDSPRDAHGTLTQCISPDSVRGRRVRYSGYIKTDRVADGSAGLWMQVDGTPEMVLAFDDMQDRGIRGTTPWTKHEIVLEVAEEATTICFGILLSGAGTAWVDDLRFQLVSRDTPTTGRKLYRPAPSNLDFEAPPDSSGFPAEWGGEGQGCVLSTDTKDPHDGRQCARIRSADSEQSTSKSFGTFTQAITADDFRGNRVRYSGYLRTQDVKPGQGALWIRVNAADGTILAFDNMADRGVSGTTPWREYHITLDVPAQAENLTFGALLSGRGSLWVDGLSIQKTTPTPD